MTDEGRSASLLLKTGYRISYGVAFVAGAFCFIVFALMVVNFARDRTADPLNSRTLELLREELRADPESEALKREIRTLDLLARRAFFTSVAFQRTGAVLLVGGVIVLLAALKILRTITRALPDPGAGASREIPVATAALARWLVASVATAAGLAAVLLMVLYRSELTAGLVGSSPGEAPAALQAGLQAPQIALWDERAQHWPSLRGPDGTGRAHYENAPTEWDGPAGENILWKTKIPKPGFSSPVVWGDRIFLTGADEDAREIYCFHVQTGELLWRHSAAGIPGSPTVLPEVTEDTGHAAPTMAVDGVRAFAVFSTGDLVAVDFDGARVWGLNLGVPENPYGHASSLLVYQDLVLVQFDHGVGASLLAFRGASGELAWEEPRDVEVSWVSPILAHAAERTELILSGNPFVTSYDPRTGRELWRVECMRGEVAASPAFAEGMIFVANEYARLAAIRLGAAPAVVWESEDNLPDVSSPVATGELLFTATGGGVVTCREQGTGVTLWEQEFDEGFYGSPILVGDRVYLMDQSGVMRIFRANREYHPIGAPELGEPSTCTAAFLDGRIYIRGFEHLYSISSDDAAGDAR